jgi:hypothetical protein
MVGVAMRGLIKRAALVAGAAVVLLGLAAGVASAVPGGTWGTAEQVPGTANDNPNFPFASTNSVSCASPGRCSAGGSYEDSSGNAQAFVVSQVNGTWGTAIEVPGTAALNQGGGAGVNSVSCARAGNCSAGGVYTDSSGNAQAFVVSQVNGAWGTAIEVPGLADLNQGGFAGVFFTVSCASPGNCSAGGAYRDSSGHLQVFVVSQVNGTWGTAIEVPGLADLNQGGFAGIFFSVFCASPGNCSAGGTYRDGSGNAQAFVVSQVNGTWRTAEQAPGTARGARIISLSCGSAGNCSAGGNYTDSAGHAQAFVIPQVNGTWGTAIEVPGTADLNQGEFAVITSVSCARAGNCSAGGIYTDSSGQGQVFVASQVNGTWGTAIEVPGTADLNQGGLAIINSVSCAPAGNCSAGGQYTDSSGIGQAFVVSQVNGAWGTAIEVPGTADLNQGGYAIIYSVSCASVPSCGAVGAYTDSSGVQQPFVVNKAASVSRSEGIRSAVAPRCTKCRINSNWSRRATAPCAHASGNVTSLLLSSPLRTLLYIRGMTGPRVGAEHAGHVLQSGVSPALGAPDNWLAVPVTCPIEQRTTANGGHSRTR